MASDRFHSAARDGLLDLLKEANRKDCNSKDDDGMTPTLWAAFEGNLDALRLLVGRGGDPEKNDNYGNTALHFASARGHMNCVTFLMNYGVNLYSKDIDHHTAKDLAALNDRQDILRFLDEQEARQARANPKKVKAQMEKATKDAEQLLKEFSQVQEKARKLAEKEKKRLEKERKRMEETGHSEAEALETTSIPRPNIRRDSRLIYEQSPKFSDLVNPKEQKDKVKIPVSAVLKKVQQQRRKMMQQSENSQSTIRGNSSLNNNGNAADEAGEFKVGAIESDGKRSVRSISGLRRDSEIMYVPKYDDSNGKRMGLNGVFPGTGGSTNGSRTSQTTDSGYGDDDQVPAFQQRSSIFERPGFGGLAFRNSISTLSDGIKPLDEKDSRGSKGPEGSVPINATSLNQDQRQSSRWDNDGIDSEEDDDEEEVDGKKAMLFFLAAYNLEEFSDAFVRDQFDLEALMLVSDADLVAMGIPRGPRVKLLKAIAERKAALQDPESEIEDSHL